jgi:hypothetical protein
MPTSRVYHQTFLLVALRGAKSSAPLSWLYVARNPSVTSSTNASSVPVVPPLAATLLAAHTA